MWVVAPSNARDPRPNAKESMKPDDLLALYKTAYDEGKKALTEQLAVVNNLRQRAVQYMAFVGTATGFLVGTSASFLPRPAGSWSEPALPVVTGFGVVSILLLVLILVGFVWIFVPMTPKSERKKDRRGPQFAKWQRGIGSGQLVELWIDPEVGGKDPIAYYRELAIDYGDFHEQNDRYLLQQTSMFVLLLVVGALSLFGWVLIVWIP
jgi:hypothetical protein